MPIKTDGTWDSTPADLFPDKKTFFSLVPIKEKINIDYTAHGRLISKKTDIIIPIYKTPNYLRSCIESLLKNTDPDHYHLYLVDDCSNNASIDAILEELDTLENVTIIKNPVNKGFSSTVNAGLRLSTNPYVCILNSDVIVTPNWLVKCLTALEASHKNAIVNPVTNNTAMIGVERPPGYSHIDMSIMLELYSPRNYPEINPTGFCFVVRRDVLNEVGVLDEGFDSYGEETDLWARILKLSHSGLLVNYRAVLADDCYVYHERGVSFAQLGAQKHSSLRSKGSERFHILHPDYVQFSSNINPKAIEYIKELRLFGEDRDYKYHIAWLVPSTEPCGAMSVIRDIINLLIDKGVDAKLINLKRNPDEPELEVEGLLTKPIRVNSAQELVNSITFKQGYIVAATAEMIRPAALVRTNIPGTKVVYHIQSDDAKILKAAGAKWEDIEPKVLPLVDYYIGSTSKDKISFPLPESYKYVYPGVDITLFYPTKRTGDPKTTVLIHANAKYGFRSSAKTIELIKELSYYNKVRVIVVGVYRVDGAPNAVCMGYLSQNQMANLLETVDLVIDPSEIHSYGLPIAEALASGVPVVTPSEHLSQFQFNGDVHALEHLSIDEIITLAHKSNDKNKERENLLAPGHDRRTNLIQFTNLLETTIGEASPRSKNIILVTPHLRKYGGPSTILDTADLLRELGNNVLVKVIYPENLQYELIRRYKDVPIDLTYENETACDLLIVNSDNDKMDYWHHYPAKKKVMLKLSHNPRFKELEEQSLCLVWDKIITSTPWLRNACLERLEGWDHPESDEEEVEVIGWRNYEFPVRNSLNAIKFDKIESINIGTLWHHHPAKGSKEAITIIERLINKYGKKIVPYVIADSERPPDKAIPFNYNLHYKPSRKDLSSGMAKCHLWLMSSKSEGLGRLGLEAANHTCAIVSSDTKSDFLKQDRNATIYPSGDIDAAVNGISSLVDNMELARNLALQAYKDAEKAYTENTMTMKKKLNSLILELFPNE